MDNIERSILEIGQNTLNSLLLYFDTLLLGLEIRGRGFKKEENREILLDKIKRLVDYRLKQKKIAVVTDLGKILVEIKDANFQDNEILKHILEKLIYLKVYNKLPKDFHLKLEEARRISQYFKEKGKEENQKKGDGVISKFFNLFGR